jgi:hypothetical protein
MNDDSKKDNVLYSIERSVLNMDTIDMSALAFFKMLSKQFPIKKDVLDAAGLKIIDWKHSVTTQYYACAPVLFNDNIIARGVELRDLKGDKKAGMLIIFNLESGKLLLADLNSSIGPFSIYSGPTGRSTKERYVYVYRVGQYSVFAEAEQETSGEVTTISFDSITPIDNN